MDRLEDVMRDRCRLIQRKMEDCRKEVERRYFILRGEVPTEDAAEKMISDGKSEELQELKDMDRPNFENLPFSVRRNRKAVDRFDGLCKNLNEVMMDFLEDCMEEVERRYFILTGEAPTEDAAEKMISDGKSEERQKLKKKILRVRQSCLEMKMLIETQRKQMDDQEKNVSSAAHYVKDVAKERNSAKIYQTISGRKFLCITIILIVIPIAFSLSKS